ncbi:hypothetical protein OIV83_001491 [Microbotryomycetes sp. JL201]|nr:hypothetical protein OIV83_001491 [Microbotryomycetes sp. JL201]
MPFEPLSLNNGQQIPSIAFGTGSTWRTSPRATDDDGVSQEVVNTILAAIRAGFRHFDTSEYYKTEKSLGRALELSKVPRNEFYIASKVGPTESLQAGCESAVRRQLALIGTDYLDLYLVHTPRSVKGDLTFAGVWTDMESLVKLGLVKSIGVSNFDPEHFEQFLPSATIPPVVNQISIYPYIYHRALPVIEFCQRQSIVLEAYEVASSVARESERDGPLDPVIDAIMSSLASSGQQASAGQVLLAWSRAKGFVTVTTSSKPERIQEYLGAGDIKLTREQVKAIDDAGAEGAEQGRGKYSSW